MATNAATPISKDDLDALAVLMADCRDEIAQTTQTMARLQARPEETGIERRLDDLAGLIQAQRPGQVWTWWRWSAALLFGMGLCLWIGWVMGRQAIVVPVCIEKAVPAVPQKGGKR